MNADKQQNSRPAKVIIGSSFDPEDMVSAFIFNQVQDQIEEVQARLHFIYDSYPLTSASSFSNDGLAGMAFIIGDMIDALNGAKGLLRDLIEYGRKLEAEGDQVLVSPSDQHGPTSFSAGA